MAFVRGGVSKAANTGLQPACPPCQLAHITQRAVKKFQGPEYTSSLWPGAQNRLRSIYSRQCLFSTISKARVLETAASSSRGPLENVLPIRRYDGPPPETSEDAKKAFIRDQLRTWSVQNQKQKEERRPESIPASRRITDLPNSLFLEDAPNDLLLDEENSSLEEYDELVEGSNKLGFEPGDLVIHKFKTLRKQVAIFLGMQGIQHQFLLSTGQWHVETSLPGHGLRLPNFISEDEVSLVLRHLPKKQVVGETKFGSEKVVAASGELPAEVSRPFLQRMAALKQDIAGFRRHHMALTDSIYDKFAHESEYVYTTLSDLAEKLLGIPYDELSDGGKMSVFMNIDREALRIQIYKPRGVELIQFILTPKNLTKQFERVVDWARQYQECAADASLGKNVASTLKDNPLSAFIDKARRLILKSRKIRSPTTLGCLGPSSIQQVSDEAVLMQPTGEEFSENDKMILEFLWDVYLRQPARLYKTMHHSIGSLILRAIGAYPKLKLESSIGRLLLQELGCMPPWAEGTDESLIFPLPGRRGAHEAQRLFTESEEVCDKMDFDRETGRIPLEDTMADLRQDLGSMEVFCIDKLSTAVIDDGYSIERCSERPGSYWIHTHIAHPTAYIKPDDLFAKRARLQGVNLYTSQTSYPMLPRKIGNNLGLRPGLAAITISTLLNEDGEVLDIKIFPSRVNNVIRLERRAVDRLMGTEEEEQAYLIIGTDPRFKSTPFDEPTEAAMDKVCLHLPSLEKIQRLVQARNETRLREVVTYPNFLTQHNESYSIVSFLQKFDSSRLVQSYHYLGDPTIKITATRYAHWKLHKERSKSQDVTANVMILTSESAGKWFGDRNIPACFSGSLTHPEFPLSKLNSLEPGTPYLTPTTTFSSSPTPHVMLSMPQYLRVTSPLRRYTDMLAFWQSDAYLRAEAEGKMAPGSSADQIQLPFSKSMVDDYILHQSHFITAAEKFVKMSTIHWAFQAMFRAFHFKEAELPEVWDMRISNTVENKTLPNDSMVRGTLHPFPLRTKVLESEEGWENEAKRDSFLPVKIELVDLTARYVHVRAVGPVSETYTQTAPIIIRSKLSENMGET